MKFPLHHSTRILVSPSRAQFRRHRRHCRARLELAAPCVPTASSLVPPPSSPQRHEDSATPLLRINPHPQRLFPRPRRSYRPPRLGSVPLRPAPVNEVLSTEFAASFLFQRTKYLLPQCLPAWVWVAPV